MTTSKNDSFNDQKIFAEQPLVLWFAEDIDQMAGSSDELQALTENLATSASTHGMDINTGKSKTTVKTVGHEKAGVQLNE